MATMPTLNKNHLSFIHYNINEYTISVEMHRETIGLFFYNKRSTV